MFHHVLQQFIGVISRALSWYLLQFRPLALYPLTNLGGPSMGEAHAPLNRLFHILTSCWPLRWYVDVHMPFYNVSNLFSIKPKTISMWGYLSKIGRVERKGILRHELVATYWPVNKASVLFFSVHTLDTLNLFGLPWNRVKTVEVLFTKWDQDWKTWHILDSHEQKMRLARTN